MTNDTRFLASNFVNTAARRCFALSSVTEPRAPGLEGLCALLSPPVSGGHLTPVHSDLTSRESTSDAGDTDLRGAGGGVGAANKRLMVRERL